MDQPNLPTQEGLNALYGAWNPMSYMQGFQNQSIADQFRQQGFQGNEQALQKGQQDIAQTALMNPERLRQIQGTNLGQEQTNAIKGLEAERATANQPSVLSEDLRAHALKMTDDEFKKADQHIESLLRSQDPTEQKLGLKLQATLPSMLAEKRKNDQAMALQQEQTRAHLGGIGMQTKNLKEMEQMRIDAGKYDKVAKGQSGAKGIMDAVASGKLTYEKAATAFHAVAQFEPDPEIAAKYEDLAAQYEAMNISGKSAGVTGKVDVGQVAGMPTQAVPKVLAPKAAPAAEKAQHSFSDVQKMYPGVPEDKIRAAYKQKFGVDLQ